MISLVGQSHLISNLKYYNVINIAEFCKEAGEPFFWGESYFRMGYTFSPNPAANFVSVKGENVYV